MKQTFTLELETSGGNERFFDVEAIEAFIKHSLGFFLGPKSMIETTVSVVEQNCGTPENINEKALSLLKRAAQSLNDYRAELDGDYNDSLATEIEEYIRDNTKEQTR